MSKLRPTLRSTNERALPNQTALELIAAAVERRNGLIHGALRDGAGNFCAIGSFFEDHDNAVLSSALIDEVAAVNDSIGPRCRPWTRRNRVLDWLRWRLRR